jgi:hypothetical protein
VLDLAGVPGEAAFERTAPLDTVALDPAQQLAATLPIGRHPDP